MDEGKGLTEMLARERQNVRHALGEAMGPVGWTNADEELALRLYQSNPSWPAEKAVEAAMGLAEGYLAAIKEERRAR